MGQNPNLTVLIPTFNEAENIAGLLQRIIAVLNNAGVVYEIIVIDDASVDSTPLLAENTLGVRGRVIRRRGVKRSLSLSVMDGINAAGGENIIVMDADGSHPPEVLPELIHCLKSGYELVVPSRYVKGGGVKDFPFTRRLISRFACSVGRSVTSINDTSSGFFGIKKSCLGGERLSPQGFKIGLEVFVKARYRNFIEIPYIFENRKKGKSKLKGFTVLQYFLQVLGLIGYNLTKKCR
ncbi:MAG: polyprenol monophosphomannose synthase [Candidatus Omnitrophica bacterium]|nr:polyprenol monophosphomannose synthase [Candidatus Omnitrophota bacterium]